MVARVVPNPVRNTEGKFQKGYKRLPGAGRVKGKPNKTTVLLRDAIIMAAENAGSNGKGKDGLVGYLGTIAKRYPKAFIHLLGRVLPYQITGAGGGPLRVIDDTFSPQEAAQAYLQMLRGQPLPILPAGRPPLRLVNNNEASQAE